ncbi:MAG: FKBP-type peptidyl-prolyl cis-trans isomerase [Candidatus Binatia bacterium]|nr:FKBP-type peptidyl-prolyl cis-trans isomerase [Candidatus Binatia bacterium]
MIKDGSKVSIEYTLTLDDGSKVDSNAGGEPLSYTQGEGQIIPGLEKEMIGLAVGDTKAVRVVAQDGYGVSSPDAFKEIETSEVPEDARKAGAMLMAQGHGAPVRVHEVRGDKIILDFNHPLADKDLNFDVKVLAVE